MTEYIKREDALKAMEWKWAGKAAFDAVKAIPSADVVERKRGKWVKNEGRVGWHCSNCGVDNNYAYSWNNDTGRDEFQDNFCPHCGSDNREVKKNG